VPGFGLHTAQSVAQALVQPAGGAATATVNTATGEILDDSPVDDSAADDSGLDDTGGPGDVGDNASGNGRGHEPGEEERDG
jgi:hypothetical protein